MISSYNPAAGDWGGLTICGKATTTAGVDATAEVGGFVYGGTTDNDNSGSIKNLLLKVLVLKSTLSHNTTEFHFML